MCEAFDCLPRAGGAEDQDPQLVRRIIEYRNAKLAVEWFGQGQPGAEKLSQHPSLLTLLKAMQDAQGIETEDEFGEE